MLLRRASLAVALVEVAQAWYRPGVNETWQIQFEGGKVDLSVVAAAYDIDGFNATRSLVQTLHDKSRRAVCYFSAGSIENYAPDAANFPASVAGKVLDGWPDERWLDVRQLSIVSAIRLPLYVAETDRAS